MAPVKVNHYRHYFIAAVSADVKNDLKRLIADEKSLDASHIIMNPDGVWIEFGSSDCTADEYKQFCAAQPRIRDIFGTMDSTLILEPHNSITTGLPYNSVLAATLARDFAFFTPGPVRADFARAIKK